MRNLLKTLICTAALVWGTTEVNAQSYKTGAGILVDAGDGTTFVGPHVKHFFSTHNALEGSVLFGGGATAVQALYQYNKAIPGAKGLAWYVGMGPAVIFGNNTTVFSIVPVVGLDLKITGAPLDLFFDWRPRAVFNSNNSDFLAGRFGIGARFTF